MPELKLNELARCYTGFEISEPVGNNAFSYASRQTRSIFVPPVISGTLDDVREGDRVVFAEMEEGRERVCRGLRSMVVINGGPSPVCVFDNHNHAFVFWAEALRQGVIPENGVLVHVDQHRDTRLPDRMPGQPVRDLPFEEIFRYAMEDLNVGNFILPAVTGGIFSEVVQINGEAGLDKSLPTSCVLDLDLDFFAPEMDYLPEDICVKRIREWIRGAALVTVASSPFFISQERALRVLRRIFDA